MTKTIIAFLLILSGNLFASQISTDRPSESTPSYVVNKGTFQLESGFQYSNYSQKLSSPLFTLNNEFPERAYPQLQLRYGLFEDFEIRYAINSLDQNQSNEIEFVNMSYGFKYRIYNSDELSYGVIFTYSDLNNRLTESSVGTISLNIPVDISLGNDFTLTSNSIYYQEFQDGDDLLMLNQIFTLGYSLSSSSVFAETSINYFLSSPVSEGEMIFLFDAGYQYVLNKNAFDIRIGIESFNTDLPGSTVDQSKTFINFGYSRIIFE